MSWRWTLLLTSILRSLEEGYYRIGGALLPALELLTLLWEEKKTKTRKNGF
jgi:hypothetical protein